MITALKWLYRGVLFLMFVRMLVSALEGNVVGALIALMVFVGLVFLYGHQRSLRIF